MLQQDELIKAAENHKSAFLEVLVKGALGEVIRNFEVPLVGKHQDQTVSKRLSCCHMRKTLYYKVLSKKMDE